jgi:hypothetical protein
MKVEKTYTSKEVMTHVEVEQFVLTLTREEAETLVRISKMISGSEFTSRRAHTRSMQIALLNAGIKDPGKSCISYTERDGIYFL